MLDRDRAQHVRGRFVADEGREGSGVGDNRTATKAVESYRKATPTGTQGLQEVTTKKGN